MGPAEHAAVGEGRPGASRFGGVVRRFLAHPLTRGMDLDDPRTTALRRRIIREKPLLRRIYDEWYRMLAAAVPGGPAVEGGVLEIGSGAGFLAGTGLIPGLITSDLLPLEGVDRVVDARALPFPDGSLRAIVMTNVLHHISEPRLFLAEAARCVRPGGVVTMIEPWATPWSRLVYRRLHHEPFRPEAAAWEFPSAGPLSGANGALAWILLRRDRTILEREFPWRVEAARPIMPVRYLLSGGVGMRSLAPGWSSGLWRGLEALGRPLAAATAMFVHGTLRRTGASAGA